MGPRVLPRGYKFWDQRAETLSTDEVIKMYNTGFAGAYGEPEEKEALDSSLPYPDGQKAAEIFGLVGSGAGKLSIPFIYGYQHWPKMWPCPGQTTGDCVSHAGKNSAIVLIGVESFLGQPDEQTGIVEGPPEVSALGEAQGVVACENIYGYRGHGGQGASCSRLQQYTCSAGGIMLRKPYPELDLDFTKYNASIGIRWGARGGPPAAVNEEGKKHQIRTCTNAPNHEVCRDFIANGYPIWACSGLGWSSSRDENGYSRQQGGWSHSWIIMGYDDRPETIRKYGFPLALYNHDWGIWNRGGRRIMGTDIDIPEGSMWIDARLLNRCECKAMSNINGWKRRDLPDWGFSLGW